MSVFPGLEMTRASVSARKGVIVTTFFFIIFVFRQIESSQFLRMPIRQPFQEPLFLRLPSPVCVSEVNMFGLRYVTFAYPDRGMVAYDLYETMNRQQWLMDQGRWPYVSGHTNVQTLSSCRFGDLEAPSAIFFGGTDQITRQFGGEWFRSHGIEVDMRLYDNQIWEDRAMNEAHEQLAAGFALWELNQAGLEEEEESLVTQAMVPDENGQFDDTFDDINDDDSALIIDVIDLTGEE